MNYDMERDYRWVFWLLNYPLAYIKYDYCLSDPNLITDWVDDIIGDMDMSNKIKARLKKEMDGREDRDDCSKISLFMNSESRFGKEWFYGYGSLYRWRNGEKDKAQKTFSRLSVRDEMLVYKIHDRLREKVEKYYK
jgi:hypothetical protein